MEKQEDIVVEAAADADMNNDVPDEAQPEVVEEANAASEPEEAPPPREPVEAVLGLDLGSSKSCISLLPVDGDTPELVRNELANRSTPALVVFHQGERYIGEPAATLITRGHVLPCLKRQLITGGSTTVQYAGSETEIASVHGAQMLLGRALQDVDRKTGVDEPQVRKLVISAPPSFPAEAVERLCAAATLAGYAVVQPVYYDISCAALVWAKRNAGAQETVMFVDVGEQFTSAQVVKFSAEEGVNKMTVLSTESAQCGVSVFDEAIISVWSQEITQKHKGVDLSARRIQARLKKEAKRTKERLSTIDTISTQIDSLTPDIDFSTVAKRVDMESGGAAFVQQVTALVSKCVADAADAITRVEVTGGGTRIPCIASVLSSVCQGLTLSKTLDSEHAVTYGACLFGGDTSYLTIEGDVTHPEVTVVTEPTVSELESTMQARDAELKLRGESKNSMEEYIFAMKRNAADEKFQKFIKDSESFGKLLETNEFWLQDYADDMESAEILLKFSELKKQLELQESELVNELARLKEKEAAEAAQARLEALERQQAAPASKKKKIVRPAEKIATAQARKEHGNRLFKDNNYEDATRRYTQALALCAQMNGTLNPEMQADVDAIKMSCYTNLSLCNMKLKRTGLARHNAESAVKMDPAHEKANFRLITALLALKDLPEAKKVIDAFLLLEPGNASILKLKARYDRAKEIEVAKEKKMYGNMFG